MPPAFFMADIDPTPDEDDEDFEDVAAELPPGPAVGRTGALVVQPKTTGLRLAQYLVVQFPDFSRSVIQKVIEAGAVAVNDAPSKASYKTRLGDRVHVTIPA